jgi:hypothetical protein
MVRDRVSPLIWCGRKPRLILPIELWTQLDKHGRKAILAHELAHLKRRDHWVCWGEMFISILYWWHPLVWWIRRRIAEEADLSCDAWVTWLMPQGRRAYAEALLKTKQFVGESRAAAPAGGLGVTTVGARRFARRLTMVMTRSGRPRTSIFGVLLATSLAAAGWVANPALSCPPEEKAAKEAKLAKAKAGEAKCETTCEVAAAAHGKPVVAVKTKPGKAATVPNVTVTPSGVAVMPLDVKIDPIVVDLGDSNLTTYKSYLSTLPETIATAVSPLVATVGEGGATTYWTLAADGQAAAKSKSKRSASNDDDDSALSERLAKLEAELKRLSQQLGKMHEGHGGPGTPTPSLQPFMHTAPVAPVPPVPGTPPAASGNPRGRRAPGALALPVPRLGGLSGLFSQNAPAQDSGEIVIKSYKLPKGKLEALTSLMIRDDVPIRVRQDGGTIEVHATQRQHEIFAAFLSIIDPDGKRPGATGSGQFTPKPAKPPKATKPAKAPKASSKSDAAEQELKKAHEALSLLERAQAAGDARKSLATVRDLFAQKGDYQKALTEALRAKELDAAVKGRTDSTIRSLVERLRSTARDRASAREGVEGEVHSLWQQAEELSRAAVDTSSQAERIAQQIAEKVDKEIAEKLEAQSKKLEDQARELEKRAREIEEKARKLEDQAGDIEGEAEEFEEQAEQLDELLEALAEAADEAAEAPDDDEAPAAEIEVIEMPEEALAPFPSPVATPSPAPAPNPAPVAANGATTPSPR